MNTSPRLKQILAACVALTMVAGAQCGQGTGVSAPSIRSQMLVSTDWLAQHLNDSDVVVLCIAASAEFCDKGRIPGARFISLGALAITRDGVPNELPPLN